MTTGLLTRGRSRRRSPLLVGAVLVAVALALASARSAPPAGTTASAASVPGAATLVVDRGSVTFIPASVTIAGGGTLILVNLDTFDHTVTSVATDEEGTPLFDVRVAAGTSATITGVEGLAEGSYPFFCKLHPQMRGLLVIKGGDGTVEPELPSFDQPLVVPQKERGALITLPMRQARVRMLPSGPKTLMWTYGGSYPGPTIVRPAGRETRVRFIHRLPGKAGALTVHLHGDHHAPEHDGQPTTQLLRPGQSRTYEYPLTYGGLPEPSSIFFYHDHRMGRTARNIWRGLQGMFIVDPDSRSPGSSLPEGKRDMPLMLADRSFRSDNALTNPFAHAPRMVGHHGEMRGSGRTPRPTTPRWAPRARRTAAMRRTSRVSARATGCDCSTRRTSRPTTFASPTAGRAPDRHRQRTAAPAGRPSTGCCSDPPSAPT